MDNSFQNSTIAQIIDAIINQLSFEGESRSDVADILLSILNQTPYEKEPDSVLAELFIKLKAKIEGESFEPFDKSYVGNIAEIIKSILDETEYNNAPNSRIAELLLELKEQIEEDFTELTASGAIASFETNVSKPLVNLTAYVKATQEAGTPTPQNPKAIFGVSELSIKHSGSDMTDYDEYIVNLGGTYYGGHFTQDNDGHRQFEVTHNIIDLGNMVWAYYTIYPSYWFSNDLINTIKKTTVNTQIADITCECLPKASSYNIVSGSTTIGIAIHTNGAIRLVYPDMPTTVEDLIADISGNKFAYPIAEPYTINLLDGQPIMAYEGSNNIWNDSSDSEVTYLYKGQPETVNLLSSNNFGGLLGMDTGNAEDDAESLQIETDNDIME